MEEHTAGRAFQSTIPYEVTRINAAALYCSDGRIGDHIDEFLHQGLGLPRYDRVACPGGPVALAGRLLAFWDTQGVAEQLRFLAQVHELRQVLLIAHAGCAYYAQRLGIGPGEAEQAQRADLVAAGAAVQRIDAELEVAAFFAHVDGTRVSFEQVSASEAIALRLKHLPPGGTASALQVPPPARQPPTRVDPAPDTRTLRDRSAPDPRAGTRERK